MNLNVNNQSFKGYSNVLSRVIQDNSDRKVAFLSVKLDNYGNKDLETFRQLKRRMNLSQELVNDDVLTLTYLKNDKNSEAFFYDKFILPAQKNCTELGAGLFSFLSDLMYQIKGSSHNNTDITGYMDVAEKAKEKLCEISKNERFGHEFVKDALFGSISVQQDAEFFYNILQKKI